MFKKLLQFGLSLIVAASFCVTAFADIYSEYNPFEGGDSTGKTYAADPRYGEINFIGHGYPGNTNEILKENHFAGDNNLEMEVDVRSDDNWYSGQTDVFIGSYGTGVLTSNDDYFGTGELGEYSHTNIFVEDYETPSGTSNITNADFNVDTSLVAANVAAAGSGSTLNVNSSEFHGTTDLNADTINIENSTINQSIGSTAESQAIVYNTGLTNTILNLLGEKVGRITHYLSVSNYRNQASNRSVSYTWNGVTYSYDLPLFEYNTYSVVDQHINKSTITAYGTLPSMIDYKFRAFESLFYAYAELFNNWYYPLRITEPLYWKTYNNDTGSEETVNLARVFYDISWYTGHIYEYCVDIYDKISDFYTRNHDDLVNILSGLNSFASQNNLNLTTIRDDFRNFVRRWAIFRDQLTYARMQTEPTTIDLGNYWGVNVSYDLPGRTNIDYEINNGVISEIYNTVYSNFYGYLVFRFTSLQHLLQLHANNISSQFINYILSWRVLRDQFTTSRVQFEPYTVNLGSYLGHDITYDLSERQYYDYSITDGVITRSRVSRWVNFQGNIATRFVTLENLVYTLAHYLSDNNPATQINNSVQSLSNNLTAYQNAEQNLQNRVTSSIQSFIPDLSLFSGFVAISWVSNYLQQIYVSLGTFGTVIMIGLLLGVCMQFIGYFRYKY